jgi:uncharacterized protein (DUF2141 family)
MLVCVASSAFCQGKIEVVITNIKVQKGDIRVGLFSNSKDFLEKPVDGRVVKVDGGKAVVEFNGLSEGEYAISVFHDENSNEELDTNFIGIPKEGFAFGNNAMGAFGPPSFEKAKVIVNKNVVKQQIALRYF